MGPKNAGEALSHLGLIYSSKQEYQKALQMYERAYSLEPDFNPQWTFQQMINMLEKLCAPPITIKNKYEEWICNHFDFIVFFNYRTFLQAHFPQTAQECSNSNFQITRMLLPFGSVQGDLFSEWSMLTQGYRKKLIATRPNLLQKLTKISNTALQNLQDI